MKILCDDFNLEATLESGQVFGFVRDGTHSHTGMIAGHPVRIWQKGAVLHVQNGVGSLSAARVRDYFDLDFDLSPVYAQLQDVGESPWFIPMKGLRLIRQDSWEALACFILSSNNNVKRIQGIYRNLVRHFSPDGGFPSPAQVARTHERILRQLGLGYRAPFLLRTAQFLSTNPYYLEAIREVEYAEAFQRVLAFPGIGPKVADCALLYGFHRLDAFPVDVWILRVMRRLFFRNRGVSEKKIHGFGRKRWGSLAGYVQQYLFHGARTRHL